jgi:hypothetical protein
LEYLKHNLRSCQIVLSKPINKKRADAIALCQIRHFGERKEKKKEVKDEEVEREAL